MERTQLIAERRAALRQLLGDLLHPGERFVWEVGCGHGHFLTAYARAHPDELCVGIDIASERIARADRKRERGEIRNLHFVRAEAEDFVASMPEGTLFSTIFILFPDPWPKRRHHKNRVMNLEFLTAVALRSSPGAGLFFRTDYEPYFREVAALFRSHPSWIKAEAPVWPLEEPTVFEKRARSYFSLEVRCRSNAKES